MKTIRRALSTPLAAAVIGGLLVSLLGWAAFAAGLVAGTGRPAPTQSTTTASSPQPVPVAQHSSGALSAASIYRRDGAGVVYVEARQRSPLGGGQIATGSGFVLDRAGHILTNAHVIDGASQVDVKLVCRRNAALDRDGSRFGPAGAASWSATLAQLEPEPATSIVFD